MINHGELKSLVVNRPLFERLLSVVWHGRATEGDSKFWSRAQPCADRHDQIVACRSTFIAQAPEPIAGRCFVRRSTAAVCGVRTRSWCCSDGKRQAGGVEMNQSFCTLKQCDMCTGCSSRNKNARITTWTGLFSGDCAPPLIWRGL